MRYFIFICLLFVMGCGIPIKGFFDVNRKIVYCKNVFMDDCGLNLYDCNDLVNRYCSHNVEMITENMANETEKMRKVTRK